MDNYWQGKKIIVTGGSSGIGLAIVEKLLKQSVEVVVVGRRALTETALSFRNLCQENKNKLFYLQGDLALVSECQKIVQAANEKLAGIDILVNVAGLYLEKLFLEVNEKEYDSLMNVNVKGMYFISQAVAFYMQKKRAGVIVNISSDAGLRGNNLCTLYCATKGAVNLFTQALAVELAPYNIRVNAVCPGDVAKEGEIEKEYLGTTEILRIKDRVSQYATMYPLGRRATAEEIAEVVFFLCSEKASFVTGALWTVDGGLTAC